MAITEARFSHTVRLACLDLPPEEETALRTRLEERLSALEVLARLDLEAPSTPETCPVEDLRPDCPRPSLPREEALANAPGAEEGWFRIEQEGGAG